MTSAPSTADPFDDVLNLEDQFYNEGYELGTRDGVEAGKIEGRSVGIDKGFDKFLESGRLYGKSIVWANRMNLSPTPTSSASSSTPPALTAAGSSTSRQSSKPQDTQTSCSLPPLPRGNARLEKNVVGVHALVEPETLSTENSDEAVNDFDDRIKRAQGRVKVVERMLGEQFFEPAVSGPADEKKETDSTEI